MILNMEQPPDFNLTGRKAFVTGGSRGLGAAIVETLARNGATVVFSYLENETAANTVVEQSQNWGGLVKAVRCDVRSRSTIHETLKTLAAELGGLDILVNNAGINRRMDFEDTTDADWDAVLDTNLKAPFMLAQEALPYLKASKAGRIINISSISAQMAGPRTVHYAVAKSGLDCLTRFLGRYCGPFQITANSVNPSLIRTDQTADEVDSPAGQAALAETPLKRYGLPEDVGNAVAFLASDAAAYITGHLLHVNRGRYL